MKKSSLFPFFILVLVAIFWGSAFVFSKQLLDKGMGVYAFLGVRKGLAALVLLPFVIRQRNFTAKDGKYKIALILGIILFFSYMFQTVGLLMTTPSKNAFLTALYVVFTPMIMYVLYKQKVKLQVIIACFFAIIGVGFLTLDFKSFSFSDTWRGDLLTIGGALFFAFHIAAIGRYVKGQSVIFLTFAQFLIVAIISLLIAFARGESFAIEGWYSWLSLAYLVIFSSVMSFGLQIWAQKHVSAAKASVIMLFEAVFAVIFSVILYGEKLTIFIIIGISITLLALILAEIKLKVTEPLPH